jgi:opacity protein-like surface antigen
VAPSRDEGSGNRLTLLNLIPRADNVPGSATRSLAPPFRNHHTGLGTSWNISPHSALSGFSLAPSGWVGGGQIGYNWEVVPHLVLGIEGDWDWTHQTDWACGVAGTGCINGPSPNGATSLGQKYKWISTLRARIGWARDSWLLYVTGGPAWAKVDTDLTVNCPLGCGNLTNTAFGSASFSDSRHGWAAGVGIEIVLWGNLTAKLEYLHLDFGNTSQIFGVDAVPPPGAPPPFTFVTLNGLAPISWRGEVLGSRYLI